MAVVAGVDCGARSVRVSIVDKRTRPSGRLGWNLRSSAQAEQLAALEGAAFYIRRQS